MATFSDLISHDILAYSRHEKRALGYHLRLGDTGSRHEAAFSYDSKMTSKISWRARSGQKSRHAGGPRFRFAGVVSPRAAEQGITLMCYRFFHGSDASSSSPTRPGTSNIHAIVTAPRPADLASPHRCTQGVPRKRAAFLSRSLGD